MCQHHLPLIIWIHCSAKRIQVRWHNYAVVVVLGMVKGDWPCNKMAHLFLRVGADYYCQRLYNCRLTQKNEELLVSNVRRQAGTQTHMWTYLEMCLVQVSYRQFSTVTELSSPSCYPSSVASPTRKDDQSSAKHTLNSVTILYSI